MASSPATAATTSIQVALRIGSLTAQDPISIPIRFQRSVVHAASPTSVSIEFASDAPSGTSLSPSSAPPAKKQFFYFDQVHPPSTTQYDLFTSTAQPLVSRFIEGFNCTILAYGQTNSGKTFTMTGIDLDGDPSDPNNRMGIIPRAADDIFSRAKQLKDERGGSWSYSIKGSFIEIYNEDLTDLLSLDDSTGGRRQVQIREDEDGHIIWGGLREVDVRNSGEVMTLIRKGTSIRRTNETDMNAQSSRSHAIFSLTLTQKKFTGSAAPTRSPSPLPPGGRSPSRLARPGSIDSGAGSASANHVSSPPLGHPGTPTFASAIGRGGELRPSNALGHAAEQPDGSSGEEWVTVVSKFHFVDLAGSERLKRTAAVGKRIKEGISINSGLLALGNVISALGDPSRAKSNTATHIPYRDSKLTRLLQDSLGGNAHTLMIACVSPSEWNAGETINTLKYANRARNIKNRAALNEREDGWDDVERLQGTVTRLQKELQVIKDGGTTSNLSDQAPEAVEGAGKKALAQMTELQNNYEDLREKFVERTEELTRLRRELGEKHRGSSSGAVGGTVKYEEIVGPVVEEYEKTIAVMETELNLNRVALRHTNEMVEEKEEELAAVMKRHAATELKVGPVYLDRPVGSSPLVQAEEAELEAGIEAKHAAREVKNTRRGTAHGSTLSQTASSEPQAMAPEPQVATLSNGGAGGIPNNTTPNSDPPADPVSPDESRPLNPKYGESYQQVGSASHNEDGNMTSAPMPVEVGHPRSIQEANPTRSVHGLGTTGDTPSLSRSGSLDNITYPQLPEYRDHVATPPSSVSEIIPMDCGMLPSRLHPPIQGTPGRQVLSSQRLDQEKVGDGDGRTRVGWVVPFSLDSRFSNTYQRNSGESSTRVTHNLETCGVPPLTSPSSSSSGHDSHLRLPANPHPNIPSSVKPPPPQDDRLFDDHGWVEYLLPDESFYYVHHTHQVVTDMDLSDEKVLGDVMAYLEDHDDVIPPKQEFWLRDMGSRKGSFVPLRCLIDHAKQKVVLDSLREANGDDRLDAKYRYWSFMESHPAHTSLPSDAHQDAINSLNWASTTGILPPNHSAPAPFTPEECQSLAALLRSIDKQGETPFHTSTVSKILLRTICWHQSHSRPDKPLPADAGRNGLRQRGHAMPICSSSLVLTAMIYACLATAINLCLSQTFMRIAGIGAILSLLSPVVANVVAAVQSEMGNGFMAPYTKRDIFSLKDTDSQPPAPLPRHTPLWQGLKFRLHKIPRPSDTTPTTGS